MTVGRPQAHCCCITMSGHCWAGPAEASIDLAQRRASGRVAEVRAAPTGQAVSTSGALLAAPCTKQPAAPTEPLRQMVRAHSSALLTVGGSGARLFASLALCLFGAASPQPVCRGPTSRLFWAHSGVHIGRYYLSERSKKEKKITKWMDGAQGTDIDYFLHTHKWGPLLFFNQHFSSANKLILHHQ